MSRMQRATRWVARFSVVAILVVLGGVAGVAPAGADPYPPVLPTGQVPAVATVPAPAVGGPAQVAPGGIRFNADSPVIAPGSYPVQARTGAGPAPDAADDSLIMAAGAATLFVFSGAIVAFYAVRRSRRTP